MPAQRIDSRRTREAILDGALVVLAERPRASLEEVARAVGVNRSTVHRHFPRRDDLIHALGARIVPQLDACHREARAEGGTCAEQLARIFRRLVLLGAHLGFFLEHWEELDRLDLFATADSWREVIAGARAEGAIREDLPLEWILQYQGASFSAALRVIAAGTLPPERVADLATGTYMAGLSPSRAAPPA